TWSCCAWKRRIAPRWMPSWMPHATRFPLTTTCAPMIRCPRRCRCARDGTARNCWSNPQRAHHCGMRFRSGGRGCNNCRNRARCAGHWTSTRWTCIDETTRKRPRAAAVRWRGKTRRTGSGFEYAAHLLHRVGFELADALGGHAVVVGQFLQGGLVFFGQPATADDVAGALVEFRHRALQHIELVFFLVGIRERKIRIGAAILEERRRRRWRVLVVFVGWRVEPDVT